MFIEANALYHRQTPIFNYYNETLGIDEPNQLKDKHVLILHGGGDISPALYNKPVAPRGGGYTKPTMRDQQEWELIKEAVKRNIPIVGICRGAQMLCAFDGGELVQHIDSHTSRAHTVLTRDGERYVSNSCHHQMMVPSKEAQVIASCVETTRGFDEQDNPLVIKEVPEVVYFPNIKAIGIQGHPEWLGPSNEFVQYCTSLINNLLLKE